MIHARLAIFGREDGVPLAKLDLFSFFQTNELPSYERVKEGIGIGGDERPSPIHMESHGLEVSLGQWWKVVEPIVGVGKLSDFLVLKTEALHDLPLIFGSSGLGHGLALFAFGFVLQYSAVGMM